MLQQLPAAATAALAAGQTLRITYATGYTHRLCLEPPQPSPAGNSLPYLLRELARRPVDLYAEATVAAAESLVQGVARRHGPWRAWTDEDAYINCLLR